MLRVKVQLVRQVVLRLHGHGVRIGLSDACLRTPVRPVGQCRGRIADQRQAEKERVLQAVMSAVLLGIRRVLHKRQLRKIGRVHVAVIAVVIVVEHAEQSRGSSFVLPLPNRFPGLALSHCGILAFTRVRGVEFKLRQKHSPLSVPSGVLILNHGNSVFDERGLGINADRLWGRAAGRDEQFRETFIAVQAVQIGVGFEVCRVAEAFVDRFRETVQRRVGLVLQRLSA